MSTFGPVLGYQDADCDIQIDKAASGTLAKRMDVISDENGDTLAQSLIHFPVQFQWHLMREITVISAEFTFLCAPFDQFGLSTRISLAPVQWNESTASWASLNGPLPVNGPTADGFKALHDGCFQLKFSGDGARDIVQHWANRPLTQNYGVMISPREFQGTPEFLSIETREAGTLSWLQYTYSVAPPDNPEA